MVFRTHIFILLCNISITSYWTVLSIEAQDLSNTNSTTFQTDQQAVPPEKKPAENSGFSSIKRQKESETSFYLDTPNLKNWYFPVLEINLDMGYLGMQVHEYVLAAQGEGNSAGHKSELEWNSFKNLLFRLHVGGQLARWDYQGEISLPVSLGSNYIYNYDWLYNNTPTQDAPSHYSRHNTEQMYVINGYLRFGRDILKQQNTSLALGGGLGFTFAAWDARDGELRYYISNQVQKISGKVLSYTIWYFLPHIYANFSTFFTPQWQLNFSIGYSPLTIWLNQDSHYSRNLLFHDYGFLGQTIMGTLALRIWNKKHTFFAHFGLDGSYLFETHGNTITYSLDSAGTKQGRGTLTKNAAGTKLGSFAIFAGLGFALHRHN